jgi:phage gp45-like
LNVAIIRAVSRLRDRTNGLHARIADLARRVFPKGTTDVLRWLVQGYAAEDEDALEVFHGTGFAARPAAGSNAEALAVAVNGGDHHVIVATRDADTLLRVVEKLGLEAGEAIVFSAGVAVKCSADKIRAQSLEGAEAAVAFKSELVGTAGPR